MSTKHFFPTTEGVVIQALDSFVTRNPFLGLDVPNKVVWNKNHSPSQISIISGGGAGHEPAWSGYVGDGMLAAGVSGEVFASPATKQIMVAVKKVPSDVGIILCITNYTGDNLHFGLAKEKATALGYKVGVCRMTDDVALGRKKSEGLGRRGLAANVLVLKMIGAATQQGWTFEQCLEIGAQGNAQMVTVGTSLDHCHIPGREHHEHVPDNACVLGMGIHNEPGLQTLSPMPSPEEVVKKMLLFLLDPNDSDRAFVPFDGTKDDVVMLIDNFGGLSTLELEALTNITKTQLAKDWNIKPVRIYAGVFETSLNGPGFSISLGNLTGMAKALGREASDLIQLLDAPTTAPAWPKNGYAHAPKSDDAAPSAEADEESDEALGKGPQVSTATLKRALQKACDAVIAAEPDITKYDIQMGDGDCGEAVSTICNSIISKLSSGPFEAESASIFALLKPIGESVENVGGSLGAILSIMLTAFSNSLRKIHSSEDLTSVDVATVGKALGPALENLKSYTPARAGDRTVMDTLSPFVEQLQRKPNLDEAVKAAEEGANSTKGMRPKFGRATYIGDKAEGDDLPPDPGAVAVAVFLRGFLEGWDGGS
ncbi:hypothetical protein H2201_007758 [Coniosporium apollinis]|uniref:Dihydroxyacetone kinase n=1 Tax=Coniosporium apollinis TaxID=61459 RepID=A0ABQ9NIH9_9PEZI|nr:hypothetical protein H2201_007758 [Coniosporium apollinis]